MPLISTLISALFITIVLIPWLVRHAERLQLVDIPDERKVHTGSVPRVGGIAMVIGMLIPFLVWFPKDRVFAGILVGIAILACFGIWDDRSNLGYRQKFGGQILASLAVIVVGDITIHWLPFAASPVASAWISYPLTVFCLLAITNAMNLSDGLDGLAGGSSVLSFGLVGLIGFQCDSYSLVILTLAVAGSILGFLRFNSHPARIFMGDTGSQFLGFVLGVMVVVMTQQVNSAISPVLPLLIFGLPVIDTSSVMVRRMLQGRSPFAPDKNHIHHQLLTIGFSHYETVVLLYFIQFGFVVLAHFLRFHVDAVVMAAFVLYSASVLVSIQLLLKHDIVRRYNLNLTRTGMVIGKPLRSIFIRVRLPWLLRGLLLVSLIVFSLPSVFYNGHIPADIAFLAGILGLLALFNLLHRRKQSWADAISMYTGCALLAYLGYVQMPGSDLYLMLDWMLVAGLGLLVLIAVMTTTQRTFETSPLDFLVILLAVLTPLLTAQIEGYSSVTLAVVKFVVLLYAFEYVRHDGQSGDMMLARASVAASMVAVSASIFW